METANVHIDDAYIVSRQEEVTPGRYVMLAVSDTGEGITDENIASIFEPFFTTKPPGVGSGLGLSMTIGFMSQSGGTVQVYTEVGKGTTFKLYFPMSKVARKPDEGPRSYARKSANGEHRVLIAEDNNAVREILVTTLE